MSISVNRNALNHCVQQNAQVKALSATGRRICTSAGDISESSGPSLKNVADRLEVPILFIAYQGQRGIKKYASYGLNTDVEFSKLTRISDQACKDGAIVHPDIRSRQEFSLFAGCSKNDAAHFYVGVPIRDGKGPVIGSIAILQENQFVAVKGISLGHLEK